MVGKKTLGEKVFNIFNVTFLFILMIITLYPLWHVAMASFSDSTEIIKHTGLLFMPIDPTSVAYVDVLKNPMIMKSYLNTIIIVVVGVTINIIMTSIGAYFLSRKGVFWQKFIMLGIVFTMYFNGGLIPNFFNVKDLGMYNTLWALMIPGAINTFNLIILRTAFSAIPDSIEESARLDGAKHFTILFQIVIPLSLPTMAVMVLYYGVAHWNSWFSAMIYLKSRDLFPLQLILREIVISGTVADSFNQSIDRVFTGETIKYATIMVTTLPILFIYPFLQKYFVKGVLVGAVKG